MMSQNSGIQSLHNLLEKYSTFPCSSGAQMFLSSLKSDEDRVSLIVNGFIPTLEDPNVKISYRILSAYLIHALYDFYETPNPFLDHLIKIFDSERIMALTASRGHYMRNLTHQQLTVQIDTEQLIWVLWKILKGEGNEISPHSPKSLSEMVVRPDFSEPSAFLSNRSTIAPHYSTHPTTQQSIVSHHGQPSNFMVQGTISSPSGDGSYVPNPIARPPSNKPIATATPFINTGQSRYVIPAHRPAPSPPFSQTSPGRTEESSSSAITPATDVNVVDSSSFHIPYTKGWNTYPEAAWMEHAQKMVDKSPRHVSDTFDCRQTRSLATGSSLLARSPGIIGSGRPSSRESSDTSSERSLGSRASSMGYIGDNRHAPGINLGGPQVIHETPHIQNYSPIQAVPISPLPGLNSARQPTPNYQSFVSRSKSELKDTKKQDDKGSGDLLQELTRLSLRHGQSSPRTLNMPKSPLRAVQHVEDLEYMAQCQPPLPQYTRMPPNSGAVQGSSFSEISASAPSSIIPPVARNGEVSLNRMPPGPISSEHQQSMFQDTRWSSSSSTLQGLNSSELGVKSNIPPVVRNGAGSITWRTSAPGSANDLAFRPPSAIKSLEAPSTYQSYYNNANYALKDANIADSTPKEDGRSQLRHPETLEGNATVPHIPIQYHEANSTLPTKSLEASHGSTPLMPLPRGSTQPTQSSFSIISEHGSPIDAQDFAKERDELTTAIILFLTARERVLTLSERRKLQPHLAMLTQPLCILRPNDIPSLVAKNQDIAVKLLTLLLDRKDEEAAEIERMIRNAAKDGEGGEDGNGSSRNGDSLTTISTAAVNFVSNLGHDAPQSVSATTAAADNNVPSPWGGPATKEKYLASLRDLPPNMQSFNVIGRLLRSAQGAPTRDTLLEDSAEARVASLIRVKVLGGFVSGCMRWIEQAEKDEKEGLVHDNRVAISTANLCRFYASLIKMGFVTADSDMDTTEIMRFALQFSRLEEARSLYSILVASRS